MTVPQMLLPVGVDCDCGHPMVWYAGERRCSVGGRHLPPPVIQELHPSPDRLLGQLVRRDLSAPLAAVVDELDAMPMPANIKRTRRDDYRRKAVG
ncbi:MAG: hypothetical protein HKN44_13360 [Ilumatobacter sp.]|nr:hypothetical protein [Ilumatobacter sp.]